uniref:Methyltransferase n=1 Tax=Kalanchoe fedtschenkoi TaxID=63787 RepID=A0A7N0RJ97_KALFE
MISAVDNGGLMQTAQYVIKISAFVFVSVALFYFGKQWSDEDQQLLYSNYGQFAANIISQTPVAAVPQSYNIPFNVTSLIDGINLTTKLAPSEEVVAAVPPEITSPPSRSPSSPPSSPSPAIGCDIFSALRQPPPPPPPRPVLERLGIVDENGTMSDAFGIGDFDSDIVEILRNGSGSEDLQERVDDGGIGVGVTRFRQCPTSMTDYIPCLDNADAVNKLASKTRGQQFERHCPEKGKGLNCLIPICK